MRRLVICLMFITLFSITALNANEKKFTEREIKSENTISFAECFSNDGSTPLNLAEKMKKNESGDNTEKYAKVSQAMFIVGLVGAIGAGVSLLMIIIGAILWGVGAYNLGIVGGGYYGYYGWYGGYYGYSSDPNVNMYLAGSVLVPTFCALLFALFIPAAVVGFVLWYVFGKKAGTISMYMENRRGVVLTDAPYQNSAAVGLKFSF